MRFLSALSVLLTFACGAIAQAPTPFAVGSIFNNKGELGIESVRNVALAQSTATPHYKSNGEETRFYEGYFKAAENTSKLALLSDDGTSVWIDGQQILNRAGQGQGFENFDSTFYPLTKTFTAGRIYHLKLQYTNTSHKSDADVDGVSLWAYDGGGTIITVTGTLQVRSKAPVSSTWGQTANVAAGGLGTTEHKADIEIRLTDSANNPLFGLTIPTLQIIGGGQGVQDGSISASVAFASSITDAQGKVTGTFTSGNRTEDTILELGLGQDTNPTVTISQKWNELPVESAWQPTPDWDYDAPSTVIYKMAFNSGTTPITGHSLEFATSLH